MEGGWRLDLRRDPRGYVQLINAVPQHARRGERLSCARSDHQSIYLLIAGSYTPFCLVTLRGPWGWSLFQMVCRCRRSRRAAGVAAAERRPGLVGGDLSADGLGRPRRPGPVGARTGPCRFYLGRGGRAVLRVGVHLYALDTRVDPCAWSLALVCARRQCRALHCDRQVRDLEVRPWCRRCVR